MIIAAFIYGSFFLQSGHNPGQEQFLSVFTFKAWVLYFFFNCLIDISEKNAVIILLTSTICPACDFHILSMIFTLIYISHTTEDYLTGSSSYCMDYNFNFWSHMGKNLQT